MRLGLVLLPLALTPLLFVLIAEGVVNLGGGEKDLFVLLPWTLGAVLFAVSSLVLWRRGWSVARATGMAATVSLGVLACLFAVLAAVSLLGVAGR